MPWVANTFSGFSIANEWFFIEKVLARLVEKKHFK